MSLSDLKNQSAVPLANKPRSGCSQNSAGQGQVLRAFAYRRNACLPHLRAFAYRRNACLPHLRAFAYRRNACLPNLAVNSHSIDQKNSDIRTGQTNLQPISFMKALINSVIPAKAGTHLIENNGFRLLPV